MGLLSSVLVCTHHIAVSGEAVGVCVYINMTQHNISVFSNVTITCFTVYIFCVYISYILFKAIGPPSSNVFFFWMQLLVHPFSHY